MEMTDLLKSWGVPKFIMVIGSSIVAVATISVLSYKYYSGHENKLEASNKYIAEGKRTDLTISRNVEKLSYKVDRLALTIDNLSAEIRRNQVINEKKFNLIIEKNEDLKRTFQLFDSTFKELVSNQQDEKKKLSWTRYLCIIPQIQIGNGRFR